MGTITLNYNDNNTIAKKAIDFIKSLGVFEVEKKRKVTKTGLEMALEDIEKGRITLVCAAKKSN